MDYFFEINHPAQVHLLQPLYFALTAKGAKVLVLCKQLKSITDLLAAYQIPYKCIGRKANGLIAKAIAQLLYDVKVLMLMWKHKPKLAIGTSVTFAHAALFSTTHSLLLDDDDDEVEPLFAKYVHPFANVILSPDCIKRKAKQSIYYHSIHEMAYLHPNIFQPDDTVLQKLGLTKQDKFFVLRFNSFKAHHDKQHYGLSWEQKKALIDRLSVKGKLYISSESELEQELKPYALNIAQHEIHSLLFYASLFVSDSQTMTTEAALLGVPALKCNSFAHKLSVPNYLEKQYDLCYAFQPENFDTLLDKVDDILSNENIKQQWVNNKQRFVDAHLSSSDFMVWFIENYPNSAKVMRENPDYQYKFK